MTTSAAVVWVSDWIEASRRHLTTKHSHAAGCCAIARARASNAIFANTALCSHAGTHAGSAVASRATRRVCRASTEVPVSGGLAARQASAAIISAATAIHPILLGVQFASFVRTGRRRRAIGKTQIARGYARGANARPRPCIRSDARASTRSAIEDVVGGDGFATIVSCGRRGLYTVSKSAEACGCAYSSHAGCAHGIDPRTDITASAAVTRGRLQIDFASVGRIVVAIGKAHRTHQSTHFIYTRSGRVRAAGAAIATSAAIADRRDVVFAAITGSHVTIVKAGFTRFNRAHAHNARFIGIRQIAYIIAEIAILHGFDRSFTTI